MRKSNERCGEYEYRPDEHDGAMREKGRQHAAKEPVEATLVRIVRGLFTFDADEVVSKQRRDHDGDDPTEDERDADDGEERGAEFAREPLGKRNGDEPRAGDERAREHRFCRLGKGVARGVEAIHAALKLYAHHLDGDDRIVYEETKRDDERAE